MDYNNQDVIIARATPIGSSAIAIIRLSGTNLIPLIKSSVNIKTISPNKAYVVNIKRYNDKQIIDKCVLIYYKSPKSYTGEDIVEISCHGGEGIVSTILTNFIEQGVRPAHPGEFSYRAVQNKKLDILQAEAIAEKINKKSLGYGLGLNKIESGETSKQLNNIKNEIQHIMMIIEHELDFNEEEITHLGYKNIEKKLLIIFNKLKISLNYSKILKKNISGYKVAILGRPNAGKSTLFNNIMGDDRAIVTQIKGTTRDVLEAQLLIKGVPFVFYDTAGIRPTKNKIEKIGIIKALDAANQSDILFIVDAKDPELALKGSINLKPYENKKIVYIKNKQDSILKPKARLKNFNYYIDLSAKNNIGIEELFTILLTLVDDKNCEFDPPDLIACNARQVNLLEQGKDIISDILENIKNEIEMDIIASQCREFIDVTEELLGKVTTNEVLNGIFKGFCVGK